MSQQMIEASEFSDVFISYRRVDVEFVKELVEALHKAGKETWIDWEDIPPGSEGFADDIKRGLEGSDAFIAVLSPDYLESKYCMDFELSYALELNKKIIPIVLRKFEDRSIPNGIGHINWIYFTPHAGQKNTFEVSFARVLQSIDLDFDHARTHKRLSIRAIEWDTNNHKNSFLLSGDEIQQAETWITEAAGKTSQPTQLHQDYIRASRVRANMLQRQLLLGVSSALIVALILATMAIFLGLQANQSANEASTSEANAVSNANLAATSEANAITNANLAATNEINAINSALTATLAQGIALNEANAASTSESNAITNANLAATNEVNAINSALTATLAQGIALNEANAASTSEANAITNANLAATNEVNAINSALTATLAQGIALNEANAASTSEANAVSNANLAATNAIEAIDNALTATIAQGEAINQQATAVFNAELALNNAATADSARAISEHLERQSRAQALAVFAQQSLDAGEIDLALALAIESGKINPSLLLAQRVLSQAAPLGVRLSLETYEDDVTFYDTPIIKAEAAYGGIFAFNHDGTLLAVANPNHDISIWDLETRKLVIRLRGHDYRITDILFDSNGQYLISSSADLPETSTVGELFVWDLSNNGQLRQLEGHIQGITDIALHPNSNIVASVSDDRKAILWDYEIGFQLASYSDEYDSALRHVTWNLDGTILYVLSETKTIIRRLDENLETKSVMVRNDPFYRGFSPERQYSYTGGYQPGSDRLTIWNADNATLVRKFGIQKFEPLEEYVRFVEFVPSNPTNILVYLEQWQRLSNSELLYQGNKLAIWDMASNAELKVLGVDDDIRITAITYSNDEKFILTADNNERANTLTLRNAETGEPVRHYFGHTAIIDQVKFTPDGNRAISVDRDGSVRVWDIFVEDPSKIQEINLGLPPNLTSNTRIPALTINGETIVVAQGSYIIPVNGSTGQTIGLRQYVSNAILDAEFDMINNRTLMHMDTNREYAPLDLWEIGGGRLTTIGTLDGDIFSDGVFVPDSSAVILVGKSQDDVGIVSWYDLTENPRNRELVYRIEMNKQDASEELADIRHVTISPDGARLATVGTYVDRVNGPTDDELIVIWDANQGIALNQFRVDTTGAITDITFSPDGNSVTTSLSKPNQIMIQWDIFTGEQQVQFVGHSDTVNLAIYNQDGTMILSGSEDNTIILWDAASGQPIRSYLGHSGSVTGVVFYNEQQSIGSISQNEILLWKIEGFEDTTQWVYNNRFVSEFTCAQRLQYNVQPYCETATSDLPTLQPITIEPTQLPTESLSTPDLSISPTVIPTESLSTPDLSISPTMILSPTVAPSPMVILSPTITPSPTITLTPTPTLIFDTGYQITSSEPVAIRVRPDATSHTLPRILQPNEFVEIIERQSDWLRVRLPDRTEGWIPTTVVNDGDV